MAAGGKGLFVDEFPDEIGHGLQHAAEHWGPIVDAYLDRLGLPHEPTSSSIRFTPDRSVSPSAFVGQWNGWWGSVGAGTGATVGKMMGKALATKGGIGTSSVRLGDIVVGAIAVVNALGDVVDPDTGRVLAGPRDTENQGFFRTVDVIANRGREPQAEAAPTNTTLAVIATNASLSKEQATKLAQVGHDGLALAVRPCHTMADGDVVFTLATRDNQEQVDMNRLCSAATTAVSRAVIRAIETATGLGGAPSAQEAFLK